MRIRRRRASFWTMLLIGLLDLALAVLLLLNPPAEVLLLVAPLLILILAAAWMLFQAWGYWILRIETGSEGLLIRAPHERFGFYLPPAQVLDCRWPEVKDVELVGLEESRTPGTGMILRMPAAALRITASDGRTVYLPYSMLKGQVREIADLVADKSGSKAPGRPRTC